MRALCIEEPQLGFMNSCKANIKCHDAIVTLRASKSITNVYFQCDEFLKVYKFGKTERRECTHGLVRNIMFTIVTIW